MPKKSISYSPIEFFYVSAIQWQPTGPSLQECFAFSYFDILWCVLKENGSASNCRCIFHILMFSCLLLLPQTICTFPEYIFEYFKGNKTALTFWATYLPHTFSLFPLQLTRLFCSILHQSKKEMESPILTRRSVFFICLVGLFFFPLDVVIMNLSGWLL